MAFASAYQLAPFHNSSLIERFLTELVSSNDLVFDISHEKERVAVAALLDRPKNGANSANLEIVALDTRVDPQSIMTTILNLSKKALPSFRDAIDINYYESFPISSSLFSANGFKLSYSMYDMVTSCPQFTCTQIASTFNFSKLVDVDFEEYHSVVMKVFEKNEDANVPPMEEMLKHLSKTKLPPTILREGSRIIGFLSLQMDDRTQNSGEINTIGLLPDYRGQGLGKLLLEEALAQLRNYGVKTFKLSVSAKNERALELYQQFGFRIHEKSSVYRWSR